MSFQSDSFTGKMTSVMSANAQHNLSALQTQLLALQGENAVLTKELSLKENHLLQKEQQYRVLQQRMEELEGSVASWKDKYLQQLQQAGTATPAPLRSAASSPWTKLALPKPSSAHDVPNADAMGSLVEKLSTSDREKLKALIGMERTRDPETLRKPWEESFTDVSEELQSVLMQYLLPVLLETQRIENQRQPDQAMTIHCVTRSYEKATMDFRIICRRQEEKAATAESVVDAPLEESKPSSPTADANPPTSTTSTTSSTSATATSTTTDKSLLGDEHLFDCIDCENQKRSAPVSHGPREIHPSKAVYISRPLPQPAPTATGSSAAAAVLRRYTVAPTKASATSVDSSRTNSGLSITGGSSTPTFVDDGDRRSGTSSNSLTGSAPKDAGKIKKIMGSVMKGLNRHKPQVTTSNPQMEEDDSICDGCGRGPISGVKWVCRTCKLLNEQEYELCEKCYGQGLHGKENEDALFERIEQIVVAKCPKLTREQELMKLLRVGICKANLKKYSFCLTWIADLLLCKTTQELRARALEISQISPQVRSEFVRLLTELLAKHRRDIELITEWQPVQNVATTDDAATMLQLDTLRIWVKDAQGTD